MDFTWGVKIPMRDGVKLSANVYKPKGMTEPLPVIFALSVYTADPWHEPGVYSAQNGYVLVFVNSRGRGDSEGSFEPYANEGRDGYDVVEWLARQPWSNGKVAMWGASYSGFTQWTTLKEFPPHLATIVPVDRLSYDGPNSALPKHILPFRRAVADSGQRCHLELETL